MEVMASSTERRLVRDLMLVAVPYSSASILFTRETWSRGGMMREIMLVPFLEGWVGGWVGLGWVGEEGRGGASILLSLACLSLNAGTRCCCRRDSVLWMLRLSAAVHVCSIPPHPRSHHPINPSKHPSTTHPLACCRLLINFLTFQVSTARFPSACGAADMVLCWGGAWGQGVEEEEGGGKWRTTFCCC